MENKSPTLETASNSLSLLISLVSVYIVVLTVYRYGFLKALGLPGFSLDGMAEQIFTYEPYVFLYSIFPWLIINIGFALFKDSESWREILAYALGHGFGMIKRPILVVAGVYTPFIFSRAHQMLHSLFHPSQGNERPQYLTDVLMYMLNDYTQSFPMPYFFYWLIPFLVASIMIVLYLFNRQKSASKISQKTVQYRAYFFEYQMPWAFSILLLVLFLFFPNSFGVLAAGNLVTNAIDTAKLSSITSDYCICGWCKEGIYRSINVSVDILGQDNTYRYGFNEPTRQEGLKQFVYLGKWDDQLILFQHDNKVNSPQQFGPFQIALYPKLSETKTICVAPNTLSLSVAMESISPEKSR